LPQNQRLGTRKYQPSNVELPVYWKESAATVAARAVCRETLSEPQRFPSPGVTVDPGPKSRQHGIKTNLTTMWGAAHSFRARIDFRQHFRTQLQNGGFTSSHFRFDNTYVRRDEHSFNPTTNFGLEWCAGVIIYLMRTLALLTCLACTSLFAQTNTPRRFVRTTGEASVSVRPDAARVAVSVVKEAATAAEAASATATATAAVVAAIRQLLGAGADVRTVAYHLTPVYNYPRDGGQPQLRGFSATEVIEATANDTALAGRIIDAAVAAGATRVDGIRLFIRDEEPSRAQALRNAALKARSKADAVALGLGVRLGAILSAQEGVSYPGNIIPAARVGPEALGTPTVIEPGTLEVRATVTLDIEIAP
jgi:uncharacterized protein YggE